MNTIPTLLLLVPLSLHNGNFSQVNDGKAVGWKPASHYLILPNGGYNNAPAIQLDCSGNETAGATQTIKFDHPRTGAFTVSAWAKCENIEAGGNCGIQVNANQDNGKPWVSMFGTPRKNIAGWQKIAVEVWPDKPVVSVDIALALQNVKGRLLLSDVRADDIPLKIKDLRTASCGNNVYSIQASVNDKSDWVLTAKQGDKEIWKRTGDSRFIEDKIVITGNEKVTVSLTASRNGTSVSKKTVISPVQKTNSVDLWTADSITRIFQEDLPPESPSTNYTIDTARNDRESFQIALRSHEKYLKNVKVSISDLKSASGSSMIPSSKVDWFRVGYLWISWPTPSPYGDRDNPAWYPDALLPTQTFNMDQCETQPLWFTVNVPKDVDPGKYSGKITLTGDGMSQQQVAFTVNVHSAIIPDKGHMKTTFALMDSYLNQVYKNVTPEIRQKYVDYMLAHHLNCDDISRTNPPSLDELEYLDANGMNMFTILNMVPEIDDPLSWVCTAPLKDFTPEFKKHFMDRLDAIMPELEKRGLIDKAYVHGFDERGPEYFDTIKEFFGAVKAKYPKLKTLTTAFLPTNVDPLDYNIDCWVPLAAVYDPIQAQNARAKGGEVWWYICSSSIFPYANCWFENPLIEPRLIWWQAFQEDVEGFLYWGVNIWPYNRGKAIPSSLERPRLNWAANLSDGSYFEWPIVYNGDGLLLYPGEDGPIGSIRSEAIRDGLEDFELLYQYKARYGEKATNEILEKVTQSRCLYTHDKQQLMNAKLLLLKELDK